MIALSSENDGKFSPRKASKRFRNHSVGVVVSRVLSLDLFDEVISMSNFSMGGHKSLF